MQFIKQAPGTVAIAGQKKTFALTPHEAAGKMICEQRKEEIALEEGHNTTYGVRKQHRSREWRGRAGGGGVLWGFCKTFRFLMLHIVTLYGGILQGNVTVVVHRMEINSS